MAAGPVTSRRRAASARDRFDAASAQVVVAGSWLTLALALIFSVMRVINFAQGEFLMLGMYATLFLFGHAGLGAALGPYAGPLVAALAGGAVLYGAGLALHRVLADQPIAGVLEVVPAARTRPRCMMRTWRSSRPIRRVAGRSLTTLC